VIRRARHAPSRNQQADDNAKKPLCDANEKQSGLKDFMIWTTGDDRAGTPMSVRTGLLSVAAIVLLGALAFAAPAVAQAPVQSPAAGAANHSAQTGPSTLLVTGAVAQDLKLNLDDLKKLPRKSVTTKGHDDQMHQYDGVPIGALLAKAGVPQGAALRGKSMALAVVAEGSDGYRAVFSVAELDDDFAAETVLVVDSIDGRPLPPDQGPLRLVIPADKRQARSVRMLKSLIVVNLSGTPQT